MLYHVGRTDVHIGKITGAGQALFDFLGSVETGRFRFDFDPLSIIREVGNQESRRLRNCRGNIPEQVQE